MRISRLVFSILGMIFFGLGFIGMFIPILPTVPFWLLSAACLTRGSTRLYKWLMTHPKYGEYIYQYREAKAVSVRTRRLALATMWIGVTASIMIVPLYPVKVFLFVVMAAVTWYLCNLTTLTDGALAQARQSYSDFILTEFDSTH